VHNVRSQAEPAISHEDSLGGDYRHRSAYLILMLSIIPVAALGQTTPTDSQTLQAILSEIRQLRHDLHAMAARAQIVLYRLQHKDELVAQAMQRLNDARSTSQRLETEKNNKALEIQQARNATSRSDGPNAQQNFEEVIFPTLKSQLEILQRQEQQAKAQEAEAEHNFGMSRRD